MAATGDNITIQGNGFSTEMDNNFVMFGEVECTVTTATETMLQCTLGDGRAGPKPLYLHVFTAGLAKAENITLQLELSLTTIHPNSGSVQGGIKVMIRGSGFATSKGTPRGSGLGYTYSRYQMAAAGDCKEWRDRVSIGGADCPITSSSGIQLVCVVPMGSDGAADVIATVYCADDGSTVEVSGSIADGFTYNPALVVTVTSISPTQGSGRGGDMVTIMGTGFSATAAENSVMVR